MTENNKQIIAAFDFDGTITQKDTFIDFAKSSLSTSKFIAGLLLFSPLLCLVATKLIEGGLVKEKLFSFWFKGWSKEDYHNAAEKYCSTQFDTLIRPKALDCIKKHRQDGHQIFIVSACTEEVLKPFAKRFGIDEVNVLGTKTEFINNKLTGRFYGANCKGIEKVNRLKKIIPNRDSYIIFAYGDSAGDKELLSFADKGFYREFE